MFVIKICVYFVLQKLVVMFAASVSKYKGYLP